MTAIRRPWRVSSPPRFEADSPHLGHRPAQSLLVEVVIPEDVIAGQPATFVDDLGSRQVAAMDERLGPLGDQERHGRRRPLLVVVSVGDDSNPHELAPPPPWRRCIETSRTVRTRRANFAGPMPIAGLKSAWRPLVRRPHARDRLCIGRGSDRDREAPRQPRGGLARGRSSGNGRLREGTPTGPPGSRGRVSSQVFPAPRGEVSDVHRIPVANVERCPGAARRPNRRSRRSFETEAPDRGEGEHEAPEARQEHKSEAPDTGDGRANWLEHEFTHGRSQS